MLVVGDKLYLGPAYYIGPFTGHFAQVDGSGAVRPGIPPVNGDVHAIAPDGAGGYYIGGEFDRVGAYPRSNLAHILADGRVGDWNPLPDGAVLALLRHEKVLFVGGEFLFINGEMRPFFASVDLTTGSLASWDPGASDPVYTFAINGSTLFVGGEFYSVNGAWRPGAAAIDLETLTTLPWYPLFGNGSPTVVYDFAFGHGRIYVAGRYSTVLDPPVIRYGITAWEDDTSVTNLLPWNPEPNNHVMAVVVSGDTVYVGGQFFSIGGATRRRIAALDATLDTNNATSWDPSADYTVNSLSLVGTTLYAGGSFDSIGGQDRNYLAALDTTVDTNNALPWSAHARLAVNTVVADTSGVAVGGSFNSIGGSIRRSGGAIDLATGEVTPFNVELGNNPAYYTLASDGTTLYLGGSFTTVNSQPRSNIAAFDLATGALTDWNPSADDSVEALAISGSTVYVGGSFANIGGSARNNIAALDATININNAIAGWDPNADSSVRSIAFSGSNLLIGGYFKNLGTSPQVARNFIAELDPSGAPTAWDPTANAIVAKVGVIGGTRYTSGYFSTIGGLSRSSIAALDAAAGNAIPTFDAGTVSSGIFDYEVLNNIMYVSGRFISIDSITRNHVAAIDPSDGSLLSWDPNLTVTTSLAWMPRVETAGNMILVGGYISAAPGEERSGIVAFCQINGPTGLTATPAGNNSIDLAWSPVAAATSYTVYRSRLADGPWSVIGSSSTPSYTDGTVDGGVTYYYKVAAAVSDCESDFSNVSSTAAAGSCGLAPDFDGVIYAVQDPGSLCSVEVAWRPALAPCGGSLTYSVYRDTSAGFTPSASNRLATELSTSTYTDNASLIPGTTYYYLVRAADDGLEDTNTFHLAVTPTGCTVAAPDPVVYLTATSQDGLVTLEWINPSSDYDSTLILFRTDGAYPADPTDPLASTAGSKAGTAGQYDSLVHSPLANGTTYHYAAYVDNGSSVYSTARYVVGRPFDTSGPGKWAYSTGATSLAPAGVIPGVANFTNANDRILHATQAGPTGGIWPAGWSPSSMNAPAQGRPIVISLPTTTVGGAANVALVGSQDGRVYVFNADTGVQLWASEVLGEAVQASPSADLTDYGGSYDLVLVGTRDPAGDSKFYGLDLATGATCWTFDNGGGADGIGIISSQAWVEYGADRVYFTSRSKGGGSSDTVWCVSFDAVSASKVWSNDVGDIDTAPNLRDGVLYVGNTIGEVYALDAASGAERWPAPYASGDGAIKGSVWVDMVLGVSNLYFATTGKVHGLVDNGSSVATLFAPLTIGGATPVFVVADDLYLGSSDGNGTLLRLDKTTGAQLGSVALGDPSVSKAVGSPAYDYLLDQIVVGTENARIYSVSGGF
jgi:outer membrane protein assembly factor BamB